MSAPLPKKLPTTLGVGAALPPTLFTSTQTINAGANIYTTTLKIVPANASVQATTLQTIDAGAFVLHRQAQTIDAGANTAVLNSKVVLSASQSLFTTATGSGRASGPAGDRLALGADRRLGVSAAAGGTRSTW